MKKRATVICWRDGRILLVERGRGRWSLPGGTIRRCESALQAAARELEEETTLVFDDFRFQFLFGGLNKRHQVFVAELTGAAMPKPNNEIRRCRWFRPQKVGTLVTSVPTREIVGLVFEKGDPAAGVNRGWTTRCHP
jgi:8-oxo-dGTP diphosphatase